MQDEGPTLRLALVMGLAAMGCSSAMHGVGVDGAPGDGDVIDVPGHPPGTPGAGAHAIHFYTQPGTPGALPHDSDTSISTPAVTTQPSGSTIVVSIGRGKSSLFALPTDNKGNAPYQPVDVMHPYAGTYPDSGTALYTFPSAAGGAGFRLTTSTDASDEITIAAVEVVESRGVVAHSWKYAGSASTVTSESVTTTGPATLVAFWWGDANQYFDKTAVPSADFTRVDRVLNAGSLVQCAVAVRNVTSAGTYNVSWTATPVQGAQLWLVAVQ